MIELLRTLSAALCEGDVTAARVAQMIGAARPRAGTLAPLVVEPEDAAITHAEIVGDDDGAPAYVRLTLTGAALTLDDLRTAFGEASSIPRSRPGEGARWAFYVRGQGQPYDCALIVETATGGPAIEIVTLRRDQKL